MAEYIEREALELFAMDQVGGCVDLMQIHRFPAADTSDLISRTQLINTVIHCFVCWPLSKEYPTTFADTQIVSIIRSIPAFGTDNPKEETP